MSGTADLAAQVAALEKRLEEQEAAHADDLEVMRESMYHDVMLEVQADLAEEELAKQHFEEGLKAAGGGHGGFEGVSSGGGGGGPSFPVAADRAEASDNAALVAMKQSAAVQKARQRAKAAADKRTTKVRAELQNKLSEREAERDAASKRAETAADKAKRCEAKAKRLEAENKRLEADKEGLKAELATAKLGGGCVGGGGGAAAAAAAAADGAGTAALALIRKEEVNDRRAEAMIKALFAQVLDRFSVARAEYGINDAGLAALNEDHKNIISAVVQHLKAAGRRGNGMLPPSSSFAAASTGGKGKGGTSKAESAAAAAQKQQQAQLDELVLANKTNSDLSSQLEGLKTRFHRLQKSDAALQRENETLKGKALEARGLLTKVVEQQETIAALHRSNSGLKARLAGVPAANGSSTSATAVAPAGPSPQKGTAPRTALAGVTASAATSADPAPAPTAAAVVAASAAASPSPPAAAAAKPAVTLGALLEAAGLAVFQKQFDKEGVSAADVAFIDHWTLRELGMTKIKDRLAFFRALDEVA